MSRDSSNKKKKKSITEKKKKNVYFTIAQNELLLPSTITYSEVQFDMIENAKHNSLWTFYECLQSAKKSCFDKYEFG